MFNTLSAADEESRRIVYNDAMNNNGNEPNTLGLMVDVLEELGCQPTVNEDETLSVKYQGETFYMEFGGLYAQIWDPMWSRIKADSPDLPKVREAVNAANFNFGPTVVMTDPDEEGNIGFLSRRDIMLHPACPDNVPFVKAVLDSFFVAKDQVRNNYQQINCSQTVHKWMYRKIVVLLDLQQHITYKNHEGKPFIKRFNTGAMVLL